MGPAEVATVVIEEAVRLAMETDTMAHLILLRQVDRLRIGTRLPQEHRALVWDSLLRLHPPIFRVIGGLHLPPKSMVMGSHGINISMVIIVQTTGLMDVVEAVAIIADDDHVAGGTGKGPGS